VGLVIGEDDAGDWLSSKETLEGGGRQWLRDIRLRQWDACDDRVEDVSEVLHLKQEHIQEDDVQSSRISEASRKELVTQLRTSLSMLSFRLETGSEWSHKPEVLCRPTCERNKPPI